MRTDFREERRWKYAVAFNIATAVLEWHAAGDPETRVAKGICVKWKRPPPPEDVTMGDADAEAADEQGMEVIADLHGGDPTNTVAIAEFEEIREKVQEEVS